MDRRSIGSVALALVLGVTTLVACGESGEQGSAIRVDEVTDDGAEFEHDFLIPAGTGDRIDAGEAIEIVPREMVVSVGEAIRIVNQDDRGHTVGVFYVGAGETLTKRFQSPGVLEGECTVHPSGAFTLRVLEA